MEYIPKQKVQLIEFHKEWKDRILLSINNIASVANIHISSSNNIVKNTIVGKEDIVSLKDSILGNVLPMEIQF